MLLGIQNGTPTLEDNYQCLRKLSITLPHNLSIVQSFASRYLPNELKTYVHMNTWTEIFIATIFIITPNWKQQKGPSKRDGWINSGTSTQGGIIRWLNKICHWAMKRHGKP